MFNPSKAAFEQQWPVPCWSGESLPACALKADLDRYLLSEDKGATQPHCTPCAGMGTLGAGSLACAVCPQSVMAKKWAREPGCLASFLPLPLTYQLPPAARPKIFISKAGGHSSHLLTPGRTT